MKTYVVVYTDGDQLRIDFIEAPTYHTAKEKLNKKDIIPVQMYLKLGEMK